MAGIAGDDAARPPMNAPFPAMRGARPYIVIAEEAFSIGTRLKLHQPRRQRHLPDARARTGVSPAAPRKTSASRRIGDNMLQKLEADGSLWQTDLHPAGRGRADPSRHLAPAFGLHRWAGMARRAVVLFGIWLPFGC